MSQPLHSPPLPDTVHARQIKHRVQQDVFQDRAQAPRASLAINRTLGDCASASSVKVSPSSKLEQALVLFDQRILRLGQDRDKRVFVQVFKVAITGKTANEFGDQTEFQQIFGLQIAETFRQRRGHHCHAHPPQSPSPSLCHARR